MTGVGIAVVLAGAGILTRAFVLPTRTATDASSSANSLMNEMAGSGFDKTTDSLEAIRNELDGSRFN